MIDRLVLAVLVLLAGVGAASPQIQRESCRTQGPWYFVTQNSKVEFTTQMDESGCRYSYTSAPEGQPHMRATVFEKAVIMKDPANGKITQTGDFSFFYKPNTGFRGKDLFVIYVCGSSAGASGCARLTYNATIR